MTPDKSDKSHDAIYQVEVPTHDLPASRVSTEWLIKHGHVLSEHGNKLSSVIGFMHAVTPTPKRADGFDPQSVRVQFKLLDNSRTQELRAMVDMGSANVAVSFEGRVIDGVCELRDLVVKTSVGAEDLSSLSTVSRVNS